MFTSTPSAATGIGIGGGRKRAKARAKVTPTAASSTAMARKRRAAAAMRSNRMTMTGGGGGCDGSTVFSPSTSGVVYVAGTPFAESGVGSMENLNPVLSASGAGGSAIGPFTPVVMYDAGGMGPVPGSFFSTGTPSFMQHGGAVRRRRPVRRTAAASAAKKTVNKKKNRSGSAGANKNKGKK